MKRVLKLMADYECFPLWDERGNVDPASLPLSAETRRALDAWAERFESWLDFDDPSSSPEPPEHEVNAFREEGVRLWKKLRDELSRGHEVHYFCEGRVLTDPSQL